MSIDEIEARKKKAECGWLADPPPHTPEPLPVHHIDKWRRMYGQMPHTTSQSGTDISEHRTAIGERRDEPIQFR